MNLRRHNAGDDTCECLRCMTWDQFVSLLCSLSSASALVETSRRSARVERDPDRARRLIWGQLGVKVRPK